MNAYVLTMSYNSTEILEKCLERLYQAEHRFSFQHVILDQHFPLPSVEEHQLFTQKIADKYDAVYFDAGKNLGYHEGINFVADALKLMPSDLLVVYDPDSYIQTAGFIGAMKKAFEADPSLAVVGLNNDVIETELNERGSEDKTLDDLRISYTKTPIVMSVVAWKAEFLQRVGGLKEPFELYGGVEAAMWPILQRENRKWAVLRDYVESRELRVLTPPIYTEWKQAHGYYGTYKGSLEDFIREKK